ncbi:MAG: ferric iron uptake transcriptional regulator [Azoarcus sp.]|jgi:Fur family ferric uptake transcriptional regulator|nr:ferric iron uptake transcriptional regulator [Azoarcus sp.]
MVNNTRSLKSIGLKATQPRLRILELFQNAGAQHLTAEDVYRQLILDDMDIGLATVYRALTQFEQAGLLERRYFDAERAVFELKTDEHHDHLVCMQCGRVEEFCDAEIERLQQQIARDRGFAIKDHALYLYADCLRENCPHRTKEDKRQRAET